MNRRPIDRRESYPGHGEVKSWIQHYRADKKLRDVVQQINLLPRPASSLVHKR